MATRLDPFRELDRFVDQALNTARSAAQMPLDVFRTGDHFVIQADLPGVDPESIDVSVDERSLTIRAERTAKQGSEMSWLTKERPSGTYVRQLTLGKEIALDSIEASYTDGVLTLTLAIAAAAKPRRVQVNYGTPTESDGNIVESRERQEVEA